MQINSKTKIDKFRHFITRSSFLLPTLIIIATTTLLWSLCPNLSSLFYTSQSSTKSITPGTIATNGAQQWIDDNKTTSPVINLSPSKDSPDVSPLFTRTYQEYTLSPTSNSLGIPLTTAFPTSYGWLQFFTSGALLLPTTTQTHTQNAKDIYANLVTNGTQDKLTGVIRLPLLQALLTAGSTLPLDGVGSSLNYADLRKATNPIFMRIAPTSASSNSHLSSSNEVLSSSSQNVFVQTGTQIGKAVGHFIPTIVWNYLHSPNLAPNGWMSDFGAPLTEALTFTIPVHGITHHMLIQAFTRNSITIDLDTPTTSQNQNSSITVTPIGLDYLRTYGLPPVILKAQQPIWTQENTILFDTANTEHAIAHLGSQFPLTLLGDTTWVASTLWYHVQLSLPKGSKNGWIMATSLTFQSPGNTIALASFDALSSSLSSYISSLGTNTGVAVYDVTRQHYYTYNGLNPFLTASSMKVPIMLTFLDMIEQQGREPDSDEMNLLTTMIENSNNDSASALYNAINGSQGINNYMQKVGVTGLDPDDDAWGYSQITPQTMVNLLALLHDGKTLNSSHRSLALNLMENVEADQQVGVGDTALANSTVALKDGWVTGPDNLWAMNSSGIVTAGHETYIISVYTEEQSSLDDGQDIARTVCRDIASLLNP